MLKLMAAKSAKENTLGSRGSKTGVRREIAKDDLWYVCHKNWKREVWFKQQESVRFGAL